jgi:selenocysteine lyase/cysteine desulfurase
MTEGGAVAGGGTVTYVTEKSHWFEADVAHREEAGSPDVVGAIRAALALQLHRSLGVRTTHSVPAAHALHAAHEWQREPRIQLVGSRKGAFWDAGSRLPLVSFNMVVPVKARDSRAREPEFKALHPHFVAAILNDLYGIQVRFHGGCAWPYLNDG